MIKKISLCVLSICSALSASVVWGADKDYQLEQILMLSRHNLRAPLADNDNVLQRATKKKWPSWDVPGGYLTTRGGILEVYMGSYTREWLAKQGLIKAGECPDSQEVYAYANSLQRTVATAQYFITGAFPGCDIQVSHQDEMGSMDPIFNLKIINSSDAFRKQAETDMQSASERLKLKPAMQRLEKMIDYQSSQECEGKKQCDLSGHQNLFSAEKGKGPLVKGPLHTANALVDAFTLQYYEGLPADQVAWGQIKTPEQWKELSAIKNDYHDVLFATPVVARDVAAPLVDYIRNILVDQDRASAPKVTLMVGHDASIASVLSSLDFKPYSLPGQYEKTPVGGMVVFERWRDNKNNQDVVKVEYVYQSTAQLRDALPLSMDRPPQRAILQMNGCQADTGGFCPWEQFTGVLNNAIQGTSMARSQPAVQAAASVSDQKAVEKAAAEQAAQTRAEKQQADKKAVSAGNAAVAPAVHAGNNNSAGKSAGKPQ